MFAFSSAGCILSHGESVIVGIPLNNRLQFSVVMTWVPASCSGVIFATAETDALPPVHASFSQGANMVDFVHSLLECFPLADKPQPPGEPPQLFPPPIQSPHRRTTDIRTASSPRWILFRDLSSSLTSTVAETVIGAYPAIATAASFSPSVFLCWDIEPVSELQGPTPEMHCIAVGYVTQQAPGGAHLFLPIPRQPRSRIPISRSSQASPNVTIISVGTLRRRETAFLTKPQPDHPRCVCLQVRLGRRRQDP